MPGKQLLLGLSLLWFCISLACASFAGTETKQYRSSKKQVTNSREKRTQGTSQLLEHKAGLYVRLDPGLVSNSPKKTVINQLQAIAANPILDAVIIPATWRKLEPEKGVFDFASLKREVEYSGSKGKGVMISVVLYGQGVDDLQTPPWLYKEKDVRSFWFAGGGTAKGRQIRLPAVWDSGFTEHEEPLVAKLAEAFDGNEAVWFVRPGLGHIGNITAQPSKGGGEAFLACLHDPGHGQPYIDQPSLDTEAYKRAQERVSRLFV